MDVLQFSILASIAVVAAIAVVLPFLTLTVFCAICVHQMHADDSQDVFGRALFFWLCVVLASISSGLFLLIHDPRAVHLEDFWLITKSIEGREWASWYARYWSFLNPAGYDVAGAIERIAALRYNWAVLCGTPFLLAIVGAATTIRHLPMIKTPRLIVVCVASAVAWSYFSYFAAAILLPILIIILAMIFFAAIASLWVGRPRSSERWA